MTKLKNYNLRVYGLLLNSGKVLITHENRAGMMMTKFPGGGHELGEGLADCLRREFDEELGISIEIRELYYVNDFLQLSVFNDEDQLISFYFIVKTEDPNQIITAPTKKLDKDEQSFEWMDVDALEEADFTFPIDKKVVSKLINENLIKSS